MTEEKDCILAQRENHLYILDMYIRDGWNLRCREIIARDKGNFLEHKGPQEYGPFL